MSRKIVKSIVQSYYKTEDEQKKKEILATLFNGRTHYDSVMKCNGMQCILNMPEAVKGKGKHRLPPYKERRAFLVDEYPACPDNWIRSSGRMKSFFIPVQEGAGMWLDFNENQDHEYDVAVVISVQGVNPITGLPCTDTSMEQYADKCPKHNIEFGPDRHCKKCGFNWPKQNYLCSSSSTGDFWLDGFRSIEGVVRQYVLTQEKMKGVASHIIGKDRVYAIGLTFYLSKNKKPARYSGPWSSSSSCASSSSSPSYSSVPITFASKAKTKGAFGLEKKKDGPKGLKLSCDNTPSTDNTNNTEYLIAHSLTTSDLKYCTRSFNDLIDCEETEKTEDHIELDNSSIEISDPVEKVQVKKLEVGAGAQLNQIIHDDTQILSHWRDDHEAMICINYCSEEDAIDILKGGREKLKVKKEGFLQGIPVGNE